MTKTLEVVLPQLDKLAEKLGTTSEYLWEVTVRQAPITGTIELLEYVILAIVSWSLFKYRGYLLDHHSDTLAIGTIIIGGMIAIMWVVVFISFGNTITAFANPEFGH